MQISLHQITDALAYWVLFWSLVNILLPPREIFKSSSPKAQQRYNTVLMLVAYYGSLNVRQLSVKLYESVNQAGPPPPPPHQLDNALVDAAASTQKTAEAIGIAQESTPKEKGQP